MDLIIAGIIVLAIGLILRGVNLQNNITPQLGYALVILGAVLIVIGLVLLAFSVAFLSLPFLN